MINLTDIIVIAIIAVIIGAICLYLRAQKKKGVKCIGCPYAKQCGGNCQGGCNNSQGNNSENKD